MKEKMGKEEEGGGGEECMVVTNYLQDASCGQ